MDISPNMMKNVPKKRIWKSLKQILVIEKNYRWPEYNITYWDINAEKSPYPAPKYSDISGLHAKYMDPNTKLYFANSDEYATVQTLPNDIVAGYLAIRKAPSVIH